MTLLFTAMFLTFSACSNDDDETTYTLVYNASTWGNYAETVRIFECTVKKAMRKPSLHNLMYLK